jgi:hypothetical protein
MTQINEGAYHGQVLSAYNAGLFGRGQRTGAAHSIEATGMLTLHSLEDGEDFIELTETWNGLLVVPQPV